MMTNIELTTIVTHRQMCGKVIEHLSIEQMYEQRRYEIAKDITSRLIASDIDEDKAITTAVRIADKLLTHLHETKVR